MSMRSKTLRNTMFSSVGLYTEYVLGMLTSIIIARHLGPERSGVRHGRDEVGRRDVVLVDDHEHVRRVGDQELMDLVEHGLERRRAELADEGPQRLGALATTFGLDPSTITRQVQALERAALVQRRDRVEEAANTTLVATLASGVLLSLLALAMALAAPLLAATVSFEGQTMQVELFARQEGMPRRRWTCAGSCSARTASCWCASGPR